MKEFIFPLNKEDLLKSCANQYSVSHILPLNNLSSKISECKGKVQKDGYRYIHTAFDSIFSVLMQWHNAPAHLKEDTFRLAIMGANRTHRSLVDLTKSSTPNLMGDTSIRNAIKKTCYLLCQTMELLFGDLSDVGATITRKGRSRRKNATQISDIRLNLVKESGSTVEVLNNLIALPIEKFWDPPVLEEDFVNCVANICFKLLEDVNVARSGDLVKRIADIFVQLVKRHNYSSNCSTKLSQQLQCYTHLSSCILTIVSTMLQKEPSTVSVVQGLLKEICSFSGDELERDPQAARSFCQFLPELAQAHPEIVIPILPFLKNHLDENPISRRNCAISVIGEVLIRHYSAKTPDVTISIPGGQLPLELQDPVIADRQATQRDKLLDTLEDSHIDVNAMVRTKVLSIWLDVVESGSLPMTRLSQLARILVDEDGAIRDVSSSVRKQAVRILIALINRNPANNLTFEEVKQLYEVEKKKLEEAEAAQDSQFLEWEKLWPIALSKIHAELVAGAMAMDDSEYEVSIADDSLAEVVAAEIHRLLHVAQYRKAIQLFCLAQEAFPNNLLFHNSEVDIENETLPEAEVWRNRMDSWIIRLQGIFLSPPPVERENKQENGAQIIPSTQMQIDTHQNLENLRRLTCHLEEYMCLAEMVQKATPIIMNMLKSRVMSDVLEGIDFFVSAYNDRMPIMQEGIRRMMTLIWCNEHQIRQAVVEAYKKIYLTIPVDADESTGNNPSRVAAQLCAHIFRSLKRLTADASLSELSSIEELLCELISTGDIPTKEFIHYLIGKFKRRIRGSGHEECVTAIALISMLASKHAQLFLKHIDELIQEGLSLGHSDSDEPLSDATALGKSTDAASRHSSSRQNAVNCDMRVIRLTCLSLQRIIPAIQPNGDKAANKIFRLSSFHPLFSYISNIISKTFSWELEDEWIAMMEQGINTIYALSENPDIVSRDVIIMLTNQVVYPVDKENETASEVGSQSPLRGLSIVQLSRFLSLGGHIALKHLAHMDVVCKGEMKRRRLLQAEQIEKNKELQQEKSTFKRSPQKRADLTLPTRTRTSNGTDGDESTSSDVEQTGMDEEADLTGVSADDQDSEFIRYLLENCIVTDDEIIDLENLDKALAAANSQPGSAVRPVEIDDEVNDIFQPTNSSKEAKPPAICIRLLYVLAQLTYKVCQNIHLVQYYNLMSSATLALAKFMLVSSTLCEKWLPLLFTLAKNSSHEKVRANLIVALGDLTKRFPNLIEPWTPELYGRLRDPACCVRVNALTTLSHLILNDMIKVKGQISEMTTCIVDKEEIIVKLSKMFFQELAQKRNALYNVMPDIISRLSDLNCGVEEDKFRTIMNFLFPYIQKERLCETLVEKICHRFRANNEERQWRNLSYCLSLMNYNEKMLKKLVENFPVFMNTLHVQAVYENFQVIIENANKTLKVGENNLEVLDDLSTQIRKARDQGVADEETMQNAEQTAARARQRHRIIRRPTPRIDAPKSNGCQTNQPTQSIQNSSDNGNEKAQSKSSPKIKTSCRKTRRLEKSRVEKRS